MPPTASPGLPDTMRAITQRRYGSVETWQQSRITLPEILSDEVLVRTHAAGLDRGTWHLMTGRPYALRLVFGMRGPKRNPIPGLDVAGTIVSIGSAVTDFSVGDEVLGIGRGSFAEYTPAKATKLARKPANIGFEQAAVVPVSSLAAWQAVQTGQVEAGQRVLVIGASGGVGSYAVQLVVALGAEVTAVASTAKLDLVRALGATHVIDYTVDDFAELGQRYDVIVDIAGNPSLARLRRALTPTGTAVMTGGEEGGSLTGGLDRQVRGMALSRFVGQRLTGFAPQERGSDLRQVVDLIAAGKVTPALDRVYPLEQAAEAMRRLESGEVRGKVALTL